MEASHLRLGAIDRLIGALRVPALCVHSARILRNLCAYAGADCYPRLRSVSAASPTVLKSIMEGSEEKLLEESIGLAAQIFRLTSPVEQAEGLEIAGVAEEKLAERLVHTLRRYYSRPLVSVPRMRRFAIELAIQMVRSRPENAERFRRCGMEAELKRVSAAAPTVLQSIMEGTEEKLLEESIGLAAQIFRLTSLVEQAEGMEIAGVAEEKLAERLIHTLRRYHSRPLVSVPRMRRFAIELAIQMVRPRPENAERFRRCGMEAELRGVAETTSELECYNVFSGSVGLSRHRDSVASLVDTALGMLLAHGQE